MSLDELKNRTRVLGRAYTDRAQRARRIFIEERAAVLANERDREFRIKERISKFFGIAYSAVSFCGSAQLGFSVHKNKEFLPAVSDLDVACIDVELFQRAWVDVVEVTRAFSDLTPFGRRPSTEIDLFQNQILRRGMIRVEMMPQSALSRDWSRFQGQLSREHTAVFKRISLAVYMNEYAFCWKQDSALSALLR